MADKAKSLSFLTKQTVSRGMPEVVEYIETIENENGKIKLCSPSRYCFLAFLTRFYRFGFSLFILLSLSLPGFSQPGGEFGIIGGGSYYLGDYNPTKHFNSTQTYWGGFYRYNFNDRFALRFNAGFSKIDLKNIHLLDNSGKSFPTEFHTSVKDISGVVEFNFRSFMVSKVEHSSGWSPYIFTGVGFLGTDDRGGVNIPLGVGVKFNVYKQISCGIEWSARKMFTDKLDGLSDPWGTGETNFIYNKDWFFVTGVTISYRFPTNPECHF